MKNNNKGFSLVELIVVIAIMAVLVGVLAPTLLRYVEKSRQQKDESAIGEVVNAINIALADETVNQAVSVATGSATTVVIADDAQPTTTNDTSSALQAELQKTIGTLSFTSKVYNGKKVTLTLQDSNGSIVAPTVTYNATGTAISGTGVTVENKSAGGSM